MPQVGTDAQSETVVLGCLVKEHLRIWRADGRAQTVRLLHPSALRELLARGVVPRAPLEAERFREIGHLDGAGVLLVGRRPFAIEVCDEPPVSDALWEAAAEVFQTAAADAIARGEFLVVEPGGWAPEAERYALAGATRTPSEWLLRVEAAPAPRAPSWPEPPEGHAGWGVAAPAEPAALAALGSLLADAVSMWAMSPLDVTLTFGVQPDGPWPPVEVPAAINDFVDEMRADVEELHTARSMSRARTLSAQIGVPLNDTSYPVFFTGALSSRVVLVHHNPSQRGPTQRGLAERDNDTEQHEGDFDHAGFDEYFEAHRRYGHSHWVSGGEHPSPVDYKQMRFLRHWGLSELVEGETRAEQVANVARAVDERLQLELIPYGSPKFPAEPLPTAVLGPLYDRLMAVITAYPRDFVILCGPVLETVLAPYIVSRDDHSFRLPTSTGTSRTEYRFSNLLLDTESGPLPVGLAPHFASPGVPMDAYGAACRERYHAEGPVRSTE
jgi:hypothetical protein